MRNLTLGLLLVSTLAAFPADNYTVVSPSGRLKTVIDAGETLSYSINLNDNPVLDPSPLSMTLENGKVWGFNPKVKKVARKSVDTLVPSPFYRAENVKECYNAATLDFEGGWSVEFRVYDDGVAYRFISNQKKPLIIKDEGVEYNFPSDAKAFIPYVLPRKDDPYFNSFENEYTEVKLSEVDKNKIAFLPLVVELDDNVKVCITESDLEQFPGLYMTAGDNPNGLKGNHAPYPKTKKQGGHNELQLVVQERENFIAKTNGKRVFPWRVAIVTDNYCDLAASNLSYLLASPNRLSDISWIKPGKVAWDWWNAWNIIGVDFKTGVNNDTYKKYIDFASENGIEYVILDEGWAVNKKADLMQVVPEIDLAEIIDYADKKNVGIVLWAGYYAFDRDMENVCKHYSDMGVKGFKVDFMDRDDQEIVDFVHRASATAAKYNLFLDLHGMYKPAGLNRTYPNVLNFEGVNGLEQMKWSDGKLDQMKYDVMIPYIRQVAGPMDYTPGAMKNATKSSYHANYYEPMSQGTRCHQLALFTIYDSPFTMLCDTPSNYDAEPESRDFISSIPTTWDETRIIDGAMGEYIITARRKGDKWYVAGITDWTPREIKLDLSFLADGSHKAILFKDGVNAERNARDYKKENLTVGNSDILDISLAPGGGFAMIID
ncbi:MAG: glycoside hydrolase family 97 protein [Muribaculaceae bacterium]|nr:glycoside hydrolase family 97 protein [Muribaculaceae bacterium]MDE6754403.1 glycoside hydrolase family 97 protein [Muribaculaceae bacterium]